MTTQPTPRQVMVVQQLPPVAWCVSGLGRRLPNQIRLQHRSKVPPKADIDPQSANVRFVPKADIALI